MQPITLCNSCPAAAACGNPYVISELATTSASFMLVTDGTDYDKSVLDNLLYEVVEIPRDNIWVTSLVKCPLSKDLRKDIHAESCFREHLIDEIMQVKPKVVLFLGRLGAKLVAPSKKFRSVRGRKHYKTLEKDGKSFRVPFITSYDLNFAFTSDSALELLATDIYNSYEASQGRGTESLTKVILCDTLDKAFTAIDYCMQVGICCFDYENTTITDLGVHDPNFRATGVSLSFQPGSSYFIPLHHFETPLSEEDITKIVNRLNTDIYANPKVRKIAHNLSWDVHVATHYGASTFRGRLDDTMLMHHLLDETTRHGLKELARAYFPAFANYEDELEGFTWETIPLDILSTYGGIDTDLTIRLSILLENMLLKDERLYMIYRNLTMAAFKPLQAAETKGMLVNKVFLTQAILDTTNILSGLETKLRGYREVKSYELAVAQEKQDAEVERLEGRIKACQQSREKKKQKRVDWLKDKLEALEKAGKATGKNYEKYKNELGEWTIGTRVVNRTKTHDALIDKVGKIKSGEIALYEGINFGSPNQLKSLFYYHPNGFKFVSPLDGTGKDILKDIKDVTGFLEEFLVWRSCNKMLGTYLKGVHVRLDSNDIVHTSFLLHGTASGRLSSRNPNLQNMPNPARLKNELAKSVVAKVKKSFIPPPGYYIVQIDYSQAELRVIADLADEATMLNAYNTGIDLHALTASKMVNMSIEDFYALPKGEYKNHRFNAKAVNFGYIYGMGAPSFKEYAKNQYGLILTDQQSEDIRNNYFDTYPKLLDYHDIYIAKAAKFGWVRTIFGRKRHLPDIDSPDDYLRSQAERAAINSPVQGSAGEFTLLAIAMLHNRLWMDAHIVNTVHDSIIFYVAKDQLDAFLKVAVPTCEDLPMVHYFGRGLEKVGLKVDVEISDTSWKDLEDYEVK